jgi:hypothetical protein
VPTASVWCYATPDDRQWWGGMWADRILESAITPQAIVGGHSDLDELTANGWFLIPHGEVLCRRAR